MSEQQRGRFVWADLMTTDVDAAISFYSEIVGWTTQVWDGPVPYKMWVAREPVGGVMDLPEEARAAGAPPHWLAYVGTPDVDGAIAMVKEMGGTVYVEPTDLPEVGRFAVFADPQGAVIAAYNPANPADPKDGPPAPGEFSWHELITTDYEAAFDCYNKLFGWEKTESMDMGDAGIYQMYGLGGNTFGGMFNKTPEMQGPPAWLHYITVESVDAAAEKVTANGGQIINGPMEVPGGDKIAQCIDPQGAVFAVHSQ